MRLENLHYEPQQCVLERAQEQRHTAYMRYTSASIASRIGTVGAIGETGQTAGGRGRVASDIAGIIA